MLKFYVFLLVLNGLAYGQFRLCPPSCKLPESARECRTFFKRASCSEDIIDLSMPEAQCACLWQTYIQNTEQAGTVIFTKDGRSCYSWAVKTCAYMGRKATPSPWLQMNGISIAEEKTSVFGNDRFDRLVEQLKTQASSKENNVPKKEVAKHRKRNGVDNILMGYNPKQSEGEKSSQQKQESQPGQQQQQKQGSQQKQQQKQESQQKQKQQQKQESQQKQKQQQKQESQPQQKQQQKQESQPLQKQEGPHPQKPIVTRIEEAEVVRSFIGSVGQSKSGQWFVIEPERTTPVNNCTNAPVEHWIDIRIPVNQFKLGVFLLILLLNTLFVVVLIFCRRSTPKKRQQKPAGDLAVPMEHPDQDASQQESLAKSKRQKKRDVELSLPESPEKESPEKESPEKTKQNLIALHFIDTWRKKIQEKKKKKKSKENMKKNSKESLKSKDNQYLQLDNCEDETAHCYTENHPTYYNADMFWPQKGNLSLGIYEELSEDLGSSDTMYEVAMPSPEDPSPPYLPKRYRVDFSSTDSSPTKNLPRSPDKRFHFAVPPGTYITLQDRMVPPIQKRSKKTKKGIGMTHRTNLKRISRRSRSAKRHIQSKNMSTINHRSLWGN